MKIFRDKRKLILKIGEHRGIKLEWGTLGWLGFAYRQDPNGFTLNFFLIVNLHLSYASGKDLGDREVKTWGGFLMPKQMIATWQWAWTGGGSEMSSPGTFKEWNFGDQIFGAPVFTESTMGTFLRDLEMPEATYPLEITVDQGAWKRPRSPFTRRVWRAKIEVADGGEIPVPMPEGEDSATYGETRNDTKTPLPTRIMEAYKRDLMEERRIVGGSYDWQPKA